MTVQRRARQERAYARLINRLGFWEKAMADEEVEFDGKTVDPEKKYMTAVAEMTNLNKKGIK